MEVVVDLQDLLKLAGIAAPQQSEPVMIPVPDQMEPEAEPVSSCGCGGMHEETDHTEDAGTEFKNATDQFHGRKDVVVSPDDFDKYSYQNQAKAKQADPNAFAQYGDNPLKESDMHKRYAEFSEGWNVGLDLFNKAIGNTGLNLGLGSSFSKGKDNKTKISPRVSVGKGPVSLGFSYDDVTDLFKGKDKEEPVKNTTTNLYKKPKSNTVNLFNGKTDPYAELDNSTKAGKKDMEKFLSQQEKDARKKMKQKDRTKSDKDYDELASHMKEDTLSEFGELGQAALDFVGKKALGAAGVDFGIGKNKVDPKGKSLDQRMKEREQRMKTKAGYCNEPLDRNDPDYLNKMRAKAQCEDVDPLVALKKRTNEAPEVDMTGPLTAQPEMNPNNVQTIINRMMPLVKAGLLNDEQLGTFRSAINQFEKGIRPGMAQRKVLADVLGKLLDIITNDLTLASRIKADLGKETQPEAA